MPDSAGGIEAGGPVITAGVGEQFDGQDLPVRLVVAPSAGVFYPSVRPEDVRDNVPVEVGQVLGTIVNNVGTTEVLSAFAGRLMAVFALGGQRLRPGDVVAWLSVGSA